MAWDQLSSKEQTLTKCVVFFVIISVGLAVALAVITMLYTKEINAMVTTAEPTTKHPTKTTTKLTTKHPTMTTTKPTTKHTMKPTTKLTTKHTTNPTTKPTTKQTTKPTTKPTPKPTTKPTTKPTSKPTTKPTTKPSSPEASLYNGEAGSILMRKIHPGNGGSAPRAVHDVGRWAKSLASKRDRSRHLANP